MKEYTNADLVRMINNGDNDQEMAIRWIYSKSGWTNIVNKVIKNLGGSKEDIMDVIQEGLISFIMDVQKGKIDKVDSAKSYFVSTCKNIWLNISKRNRRGVEIINQSESQKRTVINEEKKFMQNEIWNHLDKLLEQLGRKCKEVLKLWSMGYSHQEISKIVNYESANVSKKTKSVCIQKLKNLGLNSEDWL